MTSIKQKPSPEAALDEAARAAGNRSRLAAQLGITKMAVHKWRVCPATRVLAVEAATGVPRTALRPDLYPSD